MGPKHTLMIGHEKGNVKMIEIKIDMEQENRAGQIRAVGSAETLAAETMGAIGLLYHSMLRQDKEAARLFRRAVTLAVLEEHVLWKFDPHPEVLKACTVELREEGET